MSNEQSFNGQSGFIRAFNDFFTAIERLPNKRSFKVFSGLVKAMTRRAYNLYSSLDKGENLTFLNYGYISLNPNSPTLALSPAEENVRYQIQLYDRVAGAISWAGLDGLEVGSGRGGGAAYVARRFKPKSMTGVDLSDTAVAFCNQYHSSVEGLRFVQGDAEALQFPDESFDVIINVESSLYYPNVEDFLAGVVRILKPGGYFLYADMRYLDEVENWHGQLKQTGLKLIAEEDITWNVRQALALNQEYRRMLLEKYAPRILHRLLSRFGGSDGGRLAEKPNEKGKRIYKRFVFRKAGA